MARIKGETLNNQEEAREFTAEEIAQLPPKAQEFLHFLRDLTRRYEAASKNPPTGCSMTHGEYHQGPSLGQHEH